MASSVRFARFLALVVASVNVDWDRRITEMLDDESMYITPVQTPDARRQFRHGEASDLSLLEFMA